jgi:polyhydroxyalkanoate synthesis repressor PhaR
MVRLITRYGGGSRKLYDTKESRYIALLEIPEWIRRGQNLRVLDSRTGLDVTAQTLAQVIYEDHRRGGSLVSSDFLHEVIRRGSRAITTGVQETDNFRRWVMAKVMKRTTPLSIRESAQQIWLAGLGAFALAEQQGGKLFQSLVKKGHDVEKTNKARVEKMIGKAEKIRENANKAIERITSPFPGGVSTALHRLGIPTRKEIVTLTKRVEELTKSVERTRVKARKHPAPKPAVSTPA